MWLGEGFKTVTGKTNFVPLRSPLPVLDPPSLKLDRASGVQGKTGLEDDNVAGACFEHKLGAAGREYDRATMEGSALAC